MFELDPRLKEDSVQLLDWPLCEVRFRNQKLFPWVMLIPRVESVSEIFDLSVENQHQLMQEISRASTLLARYFQADKMNVAAIGNVVPQLHVHVVARFRADAAWPASVWQPDLPTQAYERKEYESLCHDLSELLK